MKKLEKEINKKLQEVVIELSKNLSENGKESVIFLPQANIFSMTGTVGGQLICIGLMLSQLCEKTGREVGQLLDEDFYKGILPACKELLKEGKVI